MRLLTAGLQVRVLLAERRAPGRNPRGYFLFVMGYQVYILRSLAAGKYYIGSTGDLHQRMVFHNSLGKGFTARHRPWEVVYVQECESKTQALAAEQKIKSWKSRVMIERLIHGEESLLK